MKLATLLFIALFGPAIALADDAVQLTMATQASEKTLAAQISEKIPSIDDALNNLAFYALSLSGTPYRYGGNSPDTGFDCSGFVRHVFRQSLNIELPHNAREINHLGEPVKAGQLRPGDLLFYNTLRHAFSHIGIYLGDNRFVHSPSSGGSIRVENMREPYWVSRFNGARRITSDY